MMIDTSEKPGVGLHAAFEQSVGLVASCCKNRAIGTAQIGFCARLLLRERFYGFLGRDDMVSDPLSLHLAASCLACMANTDPVAACMPMVDLGLVCIRSRA